MLKPALGCLLVYPGQANGVERTAAAVSYTLDEGFDLADIEGVLAGLAANAR